MEYMILVGFFTAREWARRNLLRIIGTILIVLWVIMCLVGCGGAQGSAYGPVDPDAPYFREIVTPKGAWCVDMTHGMDCTFPDTEDK